VRRWLGAGRQDATKAPVRCDSWTDQVQVGWGHQGGQPLEPFVGGDDQRRGAVVPRRLQRERQGLGVEPAPAGGSQGRAQHVTAQVLKALSVRGRHTRGGASTMLFDPAQWRRFLKPCFARLFAIGKQAGKPIWFHSCGDVTAVLPDLIDIGMDVWGTVQLHTLPLSPEELERQYGKHLAFFGGINTQRLPFARPQEVQEEVARCIRALGEGGGYICGPDHHLKPDVPAGNAVALFRAAVEFRQAGITRG